MDGGSWWAALALVLVLEGLFPLISPKVWRQTFQRILKLHDGQVRFFALCSVLAGLALLVLVLLAA